MIPEIGHYALVLALALGIVQGCVPFYGAQRNDPVLMATAVPTAVAQFLFIGLAFAALTACYVGSDFSVVNVFENSHSLKPLLYNARLWGTVAGRVTDTQGRLVDGYTVVIRPDPTPAAS